VDLEADAPPANVPPGEETVLALILREAVTNIVRHAHATECRVRFVTGKEQILLLVKDNGSGGSPKEGNGLRGMRERAQALGGEFSWQCGNQPGSGMELRIQLPLHSKSSISITELPASAIKASAESGEPSRAKVSV
jgi:two-component system sensor histidine kinase DesK